MGGMLYDAGTFVQTQQESVHVRKVGDGIRCFPSHFGIASSEIVKSTDLFSHWYGTQNHRGQ